jgi:hypothetical protein
MYRSKGRASSRNIAGRRHGAGQALIEPNADDRHALES